jgi:hypothetical protein
MGDRELADASSRHCPITTFFFPLLDFIGQSFSICQLIASSQQVSEMRTINNHTLQVDKLKHRAQARGRARTVAFRICALD